MTDDSSALSKTSNYCADVGKSQELPPEVGELYETDREVVEFPFSEPRDGGSDGGV